jgi:alpha-galactosidase
MVNVELDPDAVKSAVSAIVKAQSARDLSAVIDYIKYSTRSEYLREIAALAAKVDKDNATTLYILSKNYVYLAYISAMITAAVEGITSSRYAAGYYYPRVECCAALNAVKSAWMHFIATTNIPLRDAAKAWLSAVVYEPPCKVPYGTVAALRSMQSYLMALALDASL